MGWFSKMRDKGAFDFIADWADKQNEKLDEVDKKVTRQLDELGETLEDVGDKADAVLGTGDYKHATAEQRVQAFTSPARRKQPRKTKVEYGDVIGISRLLGLYEHYGVYVGNNRVIHFTSKNSDTSFDNEIIETDMSHFLRGQTTFFILDFDSMFEQGHKRPDKIPVKASIAPTMPNIPDTFFMKRYTPEETVERARRKLGCKKYDLVFNNCEHFAVWCKTGLHKSYQVEDVVRGSEAIPIIMK